MAGRGIMGVREGKLLSAAVACVGIVFVTAAAGHGVLWAGRQNDGHDPAGRHFDHRFRGDSAVAPLYWPYYYPYTYYAPAPNYYWYCPSYGAYYPSVQSCPDNEWVAVPAG